MTFTVPPDLEQQVNRERERQQMESLLDKGGMDATRVEQLLQEAGRQVFREAANALRVEGQPRSCLHLEQLEYQLPFAHGACGRGHRLRLRCQAPSQQPAR